MKRKLFAIVILLVAGAGAIFVSLGGLPTSASLATSFLTAAATVGDISDDIAATGTVAATTRYGLAFGTAPQQLSGSADTSSTASTSTSTSSSSASWPVVSVAVSVGASVKKGESLAVADATDLMAQLATATANRRSASLQLLLAKSQLSDAEDGGETDQIRQAKISVYGAETSYAQAKASEADLTKQVALATLTSPIDGVVSEVDIVPGADAPSGTAIVVEAPTYEVTADVVESDIRSMTVGQAATISIAALDTTVDGTVTTIGRNSTTSSSTSVVSYPVTVRLTDPPAGVLPGMTADVTITTASAANVLTIPSEALTGTAGNYAVRILANGTPETRPVTVGLVTNSLAEITSGLTAGETVITGTTAARNAAATTTTTNVRGLGGGGFGGGGAAPGAGPGGFGN
jgi:RND family efflux transporter MFP subunit